LLSLLLSLSPLPLPLLSQSPLQWLSLLLLPSLSISQSLSPLPSHLHRRPAVHCAATVVAHCDPAAAVAVSHCDTCRRALPPPLLNAIAPPSRHPLRCHHHCPPRLRCHCSTLRHLLTHRRPSTCRLVVTWGWLLSLHLSLPHCLSISWLVVTSPLNAPPSRLPQMVVASPLVATPPLNALTHCHLTSHCTTVLFILAGCCITPHRDTASQCVGWLYIASHCATLTFDPAGCCVTPCCHHRHPLQLRRHLAVHVTADENAWAPEPAAWPVDPAQS
jgi:hypothetical protein